MPEVEALRQRIRRREWEDNAKRAMGSKVRCVCVCVGGGGGR